MPLTALEIKSISCPPEQKQIKKFDANGLFLLVKSSGSKLWRFRYQYAGKHQELALGKYPSVPLKEARKLAEIARIQLAKGVNPTDERKERRRASSPGDGAFGVVALKWWEQQHESWTPEHARRIKHWITTDCKSIALLAVDKIDAGHIAELMLSLESAGTPKKAPVILSVINRIYGYALAHRLTRSNPAQGLSLRDILKPLPKVKHHAAIVRPLELAELIRAVDGSESGHYCTVQALKLLPRVFVRTKELRCLKWAYVDFNDDLIRIPDEEMKRGREHLIPMASQVKSQLIEVQKFTGYSEYVFPNHRDSNKQMSKNVITNRLKSLGYSSDVMTAHGFRSTASTILHEQGWSHDAIEAQLAHLTGTATSRAYNRSIYLPERKKMMQAWADYLEKIKERRVF